jgi:hypothetical protein
VTHPGHGRTECSCGVVIAQCRCQDQHKEVRVVPRGCRKCQAAGLPERATIVLPNELHRRTKAGDRIDFEGRMAYEVTLMHADGRVEGKQVEPFDRFKACTLLRRAAGTITTLEMEALVLDGDAHDDASGDEKILADIGAFLARVDPR